MNGQHNKKEGILFRHLLFFAPKNTYFCENLSNCYDIEQKTWLFNPMADWCRRFDRIESLVYGRFSSAWPEIHGSDIL